MEKQFTREELSERLKKLAKDRTEIPFHRGAMCYEPAMPEYQELECVHCGKQFSFSDYDGYERYEDYMLEQIHAMGYDAYIESWCMDCAVKEGLLDKKEADEDVKLMEGLEVDKCFHSCVGRCMIFFFRTKDDVNYHRALLRDHNDLKVLIAFLQQKKSYEGNYGETHHLRDKISLIKKLTGLDD